MKLTPVEGNPFEATPPPTGGPRLTPVEGDPFQRNFGIDFTRPVQEVRSAIAALPDQDRQEALRQWAEAYVANERAQASATLPSDVVRATARGTVIGPLLDEANALTSAGIHRLTGGSAGAPYDEAMAYQAALDRATDRERPITAGTAQVVGALAGGGASYRAARALGLPSLASTTLPRQMVIGTGFGATHAGIYGFGTSEGDVWERAEAALRAAPVGAVVGAVAPPVLRLTGAALRYPINYVSPTFARMGETLRGIPRRIGISASADGGVPTTAGTRAAAEQTMANAAVSGGVTGADLRRIFGSDRIPGSAAYAARFHSSGAAQNVLSLADVHEAMQRLLGSAARRSTDAADDTATFLRARQTGYASADEAQELAARGLPTRVRGERPLTGAQAERALGSRFGTPRGELVPMGQPERIGDAFRRALKVEDYEFHGHRATGRLTEREIVEQAEREADTFYYLARRAGRGVDLTPTLSPVLRRWADIRAQEPQAVGREVERAMRQFFTRDGRMVTEIGRFDRAKRVLDDRISTLRRAGEREMAAVLTRLKNDLLAAVDAIPTNNLGARYAEARSRFGSRMEARDAYVAGREVWKEGGEAGVESYQRLAGEGERKLFRLGLLAGYHDRAERALTGADRLALFNTPRMEEILSHVIPRTETATGRARIRGGEPAVFADAPQRFGTWRENEARMIATRTKAIGGSPTAERIEDDQAFRALSTINEIFHSSSGPRDMLYRVAENALRRVFGMRQDVAVEIARQLLNADPVQRARIVERIIERMGANRAEQLARYLQQHQAAFGGAAARGTVAATGGG